MPANTAVSWILLMYVMSLCSQHQLILFGTCCRVHDGFYAALFHKSPGSASLFEEVVGSIQECLKSQAQDCAHGEELLTRIYLTGMSAVAAAFMLPVHGMTKMAKEPCWCSVNLKVFVCISL